MKRSLALCAAFAVAVCVSSVRADDLNLDLQYNAGAGTWQLFAEITNVGTGTADGSNGLAAVRALLDNIDFGTDGDAVTISDDIGSINPVQTDSGPRLPVLDLGGTIDVLYGQDISDAESVVGGIGVGGPSLIASGSYSGAIPAFGMDGLLSSDANFLAVAAPGAQTAAFAPDNITTEVNEIVEQLLLGDANNDGAVTGADLSAVANAFGNVGPPNDGTLIGDANDDGAVTGADLSAVANNFGNVLPSLSASIATVPEPSSALLVVSGLVLAIATRRRKYCS